jgi:hypothetical protein
MDTFLWRKKNILGEGPGLGRDPTLLGYEHKIQDCSINV